MVVITVKESREALLNEFASEIIGYKFGSAKLSLIFDTKMREYQPGVTLIGYKGSAEKTLIHLPLKNEMLSIERAENFIDVTQIGAVYKCRHLRAEIIEHEKELALAIYFDCPMQICDTAHKAKELIDEYLIVSCEKSFRKGFASFAYAVPKAYSFCGILCFGIEIPSKQLGRFCGILVNVCDSSVKIVGAPLCDVKEIGTARYQTPQPGAEKGMQMYFYSGQKFCPLQDKNPFLSQREAKDVFTNKPERFRQKFSDYDDKAFVPATCCGDLVYAIAASKDGKSVLLIHAADGSIIDFNVNVDKTVKYCPVGTGMFHNNKSVIVEQCGWTEYSSNDIRP